MVRLDRGQTASGDRTHGRNNFRDHRHDAARHRATTARGRFAAARPALVAGRHQAVLCLRMSRLAVERELDRTVQLAGPVWKPAIGRVLDVLSLKPRNIRRLTWTTCDLAAWQDQSVLMIELEQGQDTSGLGKAGEEVAPLLPGAICRQVPKAGWPYPFAIVAERTILPARQSSSASWPTRRNRSWQAEPSIAC